MYRIGKVDIFVKRMTIQGPKTQSMAMHKNAHAHVKANAILFFKTIFSRNEFRLEFIVFGGRQTLHILHRIVMLKCFGIKKKKFYTTVSRSE